MMLWNRFALALLVSLVGSSAATAAYLNLPGNYGNEAGCDYLATGNTDGDAPRFLSDHELGYPDGGCSFALAGNDIGDTQLVHGICTLRGREFPTAEAFIISPPYDDGHVEVYTAEGELWGKLDPCP